MSFLPRARWGEVEGPIQEAFERFWETRGNVPNLFRVLALRPELFRTFDAHFDALLGEGTVSVRLKELVAVRVSQLNGSRY